MTITVQIFVQPLYIVEDTMHKVSEYRSLHVKLYAYEFSYDKKSIHSKFILMLDFCVRMRDDHLKKSRQNRFDSFVVFSVISNNLVVCRKYSHNLRKY